MRVWSYWHLLEDKELTLLFWGANEAEIPRWQRALLRPLRPVLAALLARMLGVSDRSAAAGLAKTRAVFAEVEAMLADGRRYLLGGEEPSFVDFTFASLAALAVFPDGYGGRGASIRRAPLEAMSPMWRSEVEALRDTVAGRFVLRMYAEERMKPLP